MLKGFFALFALFAPLISKLLFSTALLCRFLARVLVNQSLFKISGLALKLTIF
jgi:hypothetical protein